METAFESDLGSERKILVGEAQSGQLCRTGRHTFQGIILESTAGGSWRHDALFRTCDLVFAEHLTARTISTAGLYFFLE